MEEVPYDEAAKILDRERVIWGAYVRSGAGTYTYVYVTEHHVVEDLEDGYALVDVIDDPIAKIDELKSMTIERSGYEVEEERWYDEELGAMMEELYKLLGYYPYYCAGSICSPDGECILNAGKIAVFRTADGERYAVVYDGSTTEIWDVRTYADALKVARWVWENTGEGDIDAIKKAMKEVG